MIDNLIQVENGKLLTTSLLIAETFEKDHCHILRDIDTLIAKIDDNPNLDYPPLFEKSTYHNDNGRDYPMYHMTRDGFSLLAMGFTGSKALEWKLKYIAAFNAMEEKLRAQSDNRLEIAKLISQATPRKVSAIKELYPEYFAPTPLPGSYEHACELNSSYRRWIEDFGITIDWLTHFPTTDVYYSYVRYCVINRIESMGKKLFYQTLTTDFNLTPHQKANGRRYFLIA